MNRTLVNLLIDALAAALFLGMLATGVRPLLCAAAGDEQVVDAVGPATARRRPGGLPG